MNMMTNATVPTTPAPMMSSKEIADLTEKRHSDVLRDIRKMCEKLYPNAELRYLANQGVREETCPSTNRVQAIHLDRLHSETLVTGYDVVRRMNVIKRWMTLELESRKPQLPDFNNPVEAARAWADAKESEQNALLRLEAAAPAVEFVDKYVTTTGNKTFRAVAKLLGVKENVFRNFLKGEGIQYKLGNEWIPYANHLNYNRFVIKTGSTENYAYNQCLFTPKGVEWVADKWSKCKHRYGY